MKGYKGFNMKFEVLQEGASERKWIVVSEDEPELYCSGRSMIEALQALPGALEQMEKKRRKEISTSHVHHDHLWSICKMLPEDYEPYGKTKSEGGSDCSTGCAYFYKLSAKRQEALYNDWGVCANPKSHRCGLLTFEHQGCPLSQPHTGKRVYGSNPYRTVDPEHEPDQQIPSNEAKRSDRAEGNSQAIDYPPAKG